VRPDDLERHHDEPASKAEQAATKPGRRPDDEVGKAM
jgi:hypothetical protein